MTPSPTARAHLAWLLIGSICISFAPVFIRLADVPPDSAAFYRMFFAALSLLLVLLLKRIPLTMPPLPRRLLIVSGIFLSVDFMCWHRSIHAIGPGLSTLLANLQVFSTALFSALLFRERLQRTFLLALVMAAFGLLLITGLELGALSRDHRLGILFGLATALCYSGYILTMKQALNRHDLSGVAVMLVVSITCTAFFALLLPLTGTSFAIPDRTSLLALLGAGVICTTLGWSLISTGLKATTATVASLFLLLQPALAFVWDMLLFSRPTSGHELLGVAMILSAIYLGTRKPDANAGPHPVKAD